MTRLPTPGSDDGTWGDVLNSFLLTSHKSDGTVANNVIASANLTTGAVATANLQDSSVTSTKLSAPSGSDGQVLTKDSATSGGMKWNTSAGVVSSVNAKTGDVVVTKTDVDLANVDNTSDATKNSATVTLMNKSLDDNTTFIVDNLSPTKRAQFQASTISAGTTRVITLPNYSGTMYVSAGTDVSVTDGGTGRSTSTTAYGLIAAGTSATAVHQTIAPGTSGYFLKSAGTAALASFAQIAESDVSGLVADLAAKASSSTLTTHTTDTSNPHAVTKAQVGLGNVDNTSDASKPVSGAIQTALNAKIPFQQSYSSPPGNPIERVDLNYSLDINNPDLREVYVNSFKASWSNEWGALRGTSPYTGYGDALVRAIRTDTDAIGTGPSALASNPFEINDRRTGALAGVMWGRSWVDGHMTRNGISMNDSYVMEASDTVPPNLPAGTIVHVVPDGTL